MKNVARFHFRFSHKQRLTTKLQFTAVFNEQLKITQGCFLVWFRKNQEPYSRLGIMISKRAIKKATARNYLKRVIRESFRIQQHQLPKLDMVISVRIGGDVLNKVTLHKELEGLWQQLMERYHGTSST